MLTEENKKDIDITVHKILKKYFKYYKIPLNINTLIHNLGGEIINYPLPKDCNSEILKSQKDNKKFSIYINNNKIQNNYAKKSILAHILGHLIFTCHFFNPEKWENFKSFKDSYLRSSKNYLIEEQTADTFKLALLMPNEDMFKLYKFNKTGSDNYIINKIIKTFYVSEYDAIARAKQLKIIGS